MIYTFWKQNQGGTNIFLITIKENVPEGTGVAIKLTMKKWTSLKKIKTWLLLPVIFMMTFTVIFLSSDFVWRQNDVEKNSNSMLGVVLMQWYNYSEEEDEVRSPTRRKLMFYNDTTSVRGKSLNGPDVAMDDPRVITRLQQKFLVPPPDSTTHRLKLAEGAIVDSSMGQAARIRQILRYKKNGFFVECGALDGETRSNSLYFERYLNWTGLLIEADPLNFALMLTKNRHAWLSPTCLSKNPYPEIVSFEQHSNLGRISPLAPGSERPNHVDVQCFPLYSYMLALNVTNIDYFSLDVEGDELEVLKAIPFDKVNIQTLSVEFAHVKYGRDALKAFMTSKGYYVDSEVTHPDWLANDFIFVKKS